MKQCNRCKELKSLKEFSKNKSQTDGLRRSCKECDKEYYRKNKDRIIKRNYKYYRQYYKDNREKCKQYWYNYYKKNRNRYLIMFKQYYYNNLTYFKQYYQNNKEKE